MIPTVHEEWDWPDLAIILMDSSWIETCMSAYLISDGIPRYALQILPYSVAAER